MLQLAFRALPKGGDRGAGDLDRGTACRLAGDAGSGPARPGPRGIGPPAGRFGPDYSATVEGVRGKRWEGHVRPKFQPSSSARRGPRACFVTGIEAAFLVDRGGPVGPPPPLSYPFVLISGVFPDSKSAGARGRRGPEARPRRGAQGASRNRARDPEGKPARERGCPDRRQRLERNAPLVAEFTSRSREAGNSARPAFEHQVRAGARDGRAVPGGSRFDVGSRPQTYLEAGQDAFANAVGGDRCRWTIRFPRPSRAALRRETPATSTLTLPVSDSHPKPLCAAVFS